MNRRGFALLAVLWTLTALTALTGAALVVARTGSQTTRNRVLLARAEWAREACVEILLARYTQDAAVGEVPIVDLGRGTWCRARLEDPGAKLNVNLAEVDALRSVVCAVRRTQCAEFVKTILVARRSASIPDLQAIEGLGDLDSWFTTRGSGTVNVNAASREVLRVLPGFTEEAVRLVVDRRERGRPLQSADELAGSLNPSARRVFLAEYAEFIRVTSFAPGQLVAHVEGGIGSTPIVARATLTVVPVPGRLAVIRREVE